MAQTVRREAPEVFAKDPQTIGKVAATRPQNGAEYLASLRDDAHDRVADLHRIPVV